MDRKGKTMRMSRQALAALLLLSVSGLCSGIAAHGQETIKIGPADTVHVKILEDPELEQSVKVTDSGDIPLILGGNVQITNLTLAQAAAAIARDLKEKGYVLNPHVTVTIDQYVNQNVSVLGQVHSPGLYPIGTSRSIVDILAMAGGITDAADRHITIQRKGTKTRLDYFFSNDAKATLESSTLVYPGDTIIIPKVEVVYILGDVGHPGGYPMTTNDSRLSVLQAVAFAGGTLPNAVPSSARLVRKQPNGEYADIPLPLGAMQKGKKPDIALQADDIIYVPFSYIRNLGLSLGGIISAAASASIYRF